MQPTTVCDPRHVRVIQTDKGYVGIVMVSGKVAYRSPGFRTRTEAQIAATKWLVEGDK